MISDEHISTRLQQLTLLIHTIMNIKNIPVQPEASSVSNSRAVISSSECAFDAERAHLLDLLSALVITHGQKQYLSQADAWSEEAMQCAGHAKTIQGTRGAILIELGKYEEGKKLHLGNEEQARIWLNRAETVGDKIPGICKTFAGIRKEVSESNRAYLQWSEEFRGRYQTASL